MDRFEIYKKLCSAMDRKDYEDVRVLLDQLKDVIYKEIAHENIT
jgi:hypothetical protein